MTTLKTIEEIVEEFERQMPLMRAHGKLLCATASPTTYKKLKDWLRTTLTAQNQAAEERLREERKRVSRFLVERGERADDYDEYVRAVEQAELDQDVSK